MKTKENKQMEPNENSDAFAEQRKTINKMKRQSTEGRKHLKMMRPTRA